MKKFLATILVSFFAFNSAVLAENGVCNPDLPVKAYVECIDRERQFAIDALMGYGIIEEEPELEPYQQYVPIHYVDENGNTEKVVNERVAFIFPDKEEHERINREFSPRQQDTLESWMVFKDLAAPYSDWNGDGIRDERTFRIACDSNGESWNCYYHGPTASYNVPDTNTPGLEGEPDWVPSGEDLVNAFQEISNTEGNDFTYQFSNGCVKVKYRGVGGLVTEYTRRCFMRTRWT